MKEEANNTILRVRTPDFMIEPYPDFIKRVSAGAGGEALLVMGTEKTALVDCGMAYCAKYMIENVHKALEGTGLTLDYVLATHSHYDHIGALSAVKEEWPDVVICASAYAAKIFTRPGAIRLMEKLSRSADELYTGCAESQLVLKPENMQVGKVMHEGDFVDLGRRKIYALETPGHTNCCLSYVCEPDRIIFLSETTGCLQSEHSVSSEVLKSVADTIASVEKCRKYEDYRTILPHHGLIPREFHEAFWTMFEDDLQNKLEFARRYMDILSEEEIVRLYVRKFWTPEREKEQPFMAFCENARAQMKAALIFWNT